MNRKQASFVASLVIVLCLIYVVWGLITRHEIAIYAVVLILGSAGAFLVLFA